MRGSDDQPVDRAEPVTGGELRMVHARGETARQARTTVPSAGPVHRTGPLDGGVEHHIDGAEHAGGRRAHGGPQPRVPTEALRLGEPAGFTGGEGIDVRTVVHTSDRCFDPGCSPGIGGFDDHDAREAAHRISDPCRLACRVEGMRCGDVVEGIVHAQRHRAPPPVRHGASASAATENEAAPPAGPIWSSDAPCTRRPSPHCPHVAATWNTSCSSARASPCDRPPRCRRRVRR